jgi:hypothetical protein
VYGNTAVVVGDVDFHMNTGGVQTVPSQRAARAGEGPQGWQLVARQAVKYPEAAPAGKK